MTTKNHGRYCWHELMTTDPEAAKAFYTALMPWTMRGWEGGEGAYEMWMLGERALGGLMPLPDEAKAAGAPPQWTPYISVDEIEATVAQAKELGATVLVPPTQIPGAGIFSSLRDPQGAAFSVYQMNDKESVSDAKGPGEFTWHELATTDAEAALAFYGALFGWERAGESAMGPMGTYYLFSFAGPAAMGGVYHKPSDRPGPPAWLCYVTVSDLDAAVAHARESGGELLSGPMEVEGGDRIAQLRDPQGAPFALHEASPKGK